MPRSNAIRVGVVGCGNIAEYHLRAIRGIPNVILTAVCDTEESRAKDAASRHEAAHCYHDLRAMLADAALDVVHIVTPPQSHATLAVDALKAGCHVFIEKPLCLTVEEADRIYANAETGRLVGVDHTNLWSPLVQRAHTIIRSGRVGRVLDVQYVVGDDYLDVLRRGQARWALSLRGGPMCDLLPHPLYVIRLFLPDVQPIFASACGANISDLRELWVAFGSSGAAASLWLSLNQRPIEHSVRIHCTRGTVHVDLRNFCLSVVPERGLPGPAARVINTVSDAASRSIGTLGSALGLVTGRFDPHVGTREAIRAFYVAIADGGSSPISRADATAVVALGQTIWDLLEKPGAINPARDEAGNLIAPRSRSVFELAAEGGAAKALVTGGTGFIGSHLVRRLVAHGERVRVYCRESSSLDALPSMGVELALGDIGDYAAVERAARGVEVIYHLAATMHGDRSAFLRGTEEGTRNVLEAAARCGVKRVVLVSSLGVLHACRFPNGGRIDEAFPLDQRPETRGLYTQAKLRAECLARELAEKLEVELCVIRPGLVYGPGRSGFLPDAGFRLSNGFALVVGLGGRLLALTYVSNLVDAIIRAGCSPDASGKTFHIVDPEQPTVRQYLAHYRRATASRLVALYLPTIIWLMGFSLLDLLIHVATGRAPTMVYKLRSIARGPRFDTSAAAHCLGWAAGVSIKEALDRTYSA